MPRIYKSKLNDIPDDVFKVAVAAAPSYTALTRMLGLSGGGAQWVRVKKRVEASGLSTAHFKSVGGKGGKTKLDYILKKGVPYAQRFRLRERLLEEGVFENRCYRCPQGPIWNGEPLGMIIHHINFNVNDSRLENLTLLCPNCYAQVSKPWHSRVGGSTGHIARKRNQRQKEYQEVAREMGIKSEGLPRATNARGWRKA